MVTNVLENNHLVLIGKVANEKRYSHEIYGEKFYIFDLEVKRLSDAVDIIPVTVSERLLPEVDLEVGNRVVVEGQFRSYNNYENERNRLILTVFAKDIVKAEEEVPQEDDNEEERKMPVSNEVVLSGYVCKKPIYRQTPFNREIADVLLAVNRSYNKSDYIPCIAWGRNARFCQNIEVGTEIRIVGRVQSRQYEKKFEDGTSEMRVAYEVSISSMEIVEKNDDNKDVEDVG
ncbi:MAG: single-stranded DNA-binding protein [Clostridia bacterium]|nr:single-stranded DNA-binding protein [Clostridia bacterium]